MLVVCIKEMIATKAVWAKQTSPNLSGRSNDPVGYCIPG